MKSKHFPYGLYLFVGESGSGKTVAINEYIYRRIKENPINEVNRELHHVDLDGTWHYGVSSVLMFSCENCNEFSDVCKLYCQENSKISVFDNYDMHKDCKHIIERAVTARLNKEVIIVSYKSYALVPKEILALARFIFEPVTFVGRFTFVSVYKPHFSIDGQICKKRLIKKHFFIQNDKIRGLSEGDEN